MLALKNYASASIDSNTTTLDSHTTAIATKIGHADYATPTSGGTVKIRNDGVGNLYITTDGTNP